MSRLTRGTLITFLLTAPSTVLAQAPAAPAPEPTPQPAAPDAYGQAPSAPTPEPSAPPVAPGAEPVQPAAAPAPTPPAPPASLLENMVSKFKVQFYGFAELDIIHDSTQSFNEAAGDGLIAKPNTYAGEHGRMAVSARDSRFGFRITGPSTETIKTSAVIEADFLGNQPSAPPATSETAFYTNPTLRMRHYWFKVETPYVDLQAGQSWALFGWQPYFDPASVEIQGLPGQVFGRTPNLRLSHNFKSDAVNVEVAVAASRPPQRDGDIPDGQGGLRLTINDWKGYRTVGSAGTALDSAAIGVSGMVRNFTVAELSPTPLNSNHATGWGFSADAMLPIVPASKEDHSNALTLTGSFSTGSGNADQYAALSGGVSFPRVPAADGTMVAFPSNIDNGLVTYDANGDLHTIDWTAYIVGLQYYLPFGGLWLSGNYSHMHSGNICDYGAAPGGIFTDSDFYDANLFLDALNNSLRFGLEYAHFQQKYADGVKAKNDRIQFASFFFF